MGVFANPDEAAEKLIIIANIVTELRELNGKCKVQKRWELG